MSVLRLSVMEGMLLSGILLEISFNRVQLKLSYVMVESDSYLITVNRVATPVLLQSSILRLNILGHIVLEVMPAEIWLNRINPKLRYRAIGWIDGLITNRVAIPDLWQTSILRLRILGDIVLAIVQAEIQFNCINPKLRYRAIGWIDGLITNRVAIPDLRQTSILRLSFKEGVEISFDHIHRKLSYAKPEPQVYFIISKAPTTYTSTPVMVIRVEVSDVFLPKKILLVRLHSSGLFQFGSIYQSMRVAIIRHLFIVSR